MGKAIFKNRMGLKVPLKVTHHITYRCNLNCLHCNRENLASKEMSINEIFQMMDEFKQLGTIFWTFNGGEPLIREDISELAKYAKSLDFNTTILTNGHLLDKRKKSLEFFDRAIISLDGPQKVNDRLRGKGSYKKAIHAIKIFKDLGKETWILTVIHDSNLDWLDYMAKLAYKNDIKLVFQPLQHRNPHFVIKKKEFKKAIDRLINLKKEGLPILSSFKYLNLLKKYYPDKNPVKCWAGKFYCNIGPDGSVYPCCHKLHLTDTPNGLRIGYQNALKKIGDYSNCKECYYYGSTELNLMMNLSMRLYWDLLKEMKK